MPIADTVDGENNIIPHTGLGLTN